MAEASAARIKELGAALRLADLQLLAEKAENSGQMEAVVNLLCLSREESERSALEPLLRSLIGTPLHLKVMKAMVVENFDNVSVPNKLAESHRELIYTEMDRLSEACVVQLLKLCMQKLGEEESPTGYRGLPLLGRLLEVVERKNQVTPDVGLPPFQGSEYKSRLVEEITRMPWSQSRLDSLCPMFKEVRLNKEDLARVFNKVCSCLDQSTAQNIPGLVYHLLVLSKSDPISSSQLLKNVTDYFGSRLSQEDRGNATVNPELDSIEVETDRRVEELQEAEGTVVYYITQQSRAGHPIAKELVKLVKAGAQAPEVILNPCSIFLALALTTVKHMQTQLLEALRTAIRRCFQMEEKRREHAWLRDVVPRVGDISSLLSLIISQSKKAGGWDLIGQGLVDLGLHLLDQQPPGLSTKVPFIVGCQHRLGASLLAKVVKRQCRAASLVVAPLTTKIVQSKGSPQYTEALRVIVSESATVLMEQPRLWTELVENLPTLDHFTARRALAAIGQLIRLNKTLRDAVIIVLRKALFSRAVASRQTAVTGILLLLRIFKIKTNHAVSQLSQSSGSLSQLAMDITQRGIGASSHDVLCSELLGVLKRCFTLQAEVKLTLYGGLFEVVSKNPEVCEAVVELLHGHLVALVGQQAEVPLERVVGEVDGEVVLLEPAGWFLHTVQAMVGKGEQLLDGENAELLERLKVTLDKMADHYAAAEPADLGFDAGDTWDRKTREGERRHLKAEVVLTVFEALVEYVITHGGDSYLEKTDLLVRLQSKHAALKAVMADGASKKPKAVKKGRKEEEGGKKGEEAEGGKEKVTGGKRGRPGADSQRKFVHPGQAISLKAVNIIVDALLTDRSPRHQAALSQLRNNEAFTSWILALMADKLKQVERNLSLTGNEGQSDGTFRYLAELAKSLFQHTVYLDETVASAVLPVAETLLVLLKMLLTSFPRRKLHILNELTSKSTEASEDNLNPLVVPLLLDVVKRLAEVLGDKMALDDEEQRPVLAISLVSLVSVILPELDEQDGYLQVKELIPNIRNSFHGNETDVVNAMASLLFQLSRKTKTTDSLGLEVAKGIHSLLGDVSTDHQTERVMNLEWLTPDSAPILLAHMEQQLEMGEMAVSWCRATKAPSPALSKGEVQVVKFLLNQIYCSLELTRSHLAVGTAMDHLLKVLLKLFTALDNLTKHFLSRLAGKSQETVAEERVVERAAFDKMVNRMNAPEIVLTRRVYAMITHMEEKRNEQEGQANAARIAKKKTINPEIARAKVLKDTRCIPELICRIELLESHLIKLGKRMGLKEGLIKGGKLTQARDFRIKLTEEMERRLVERDDNQEDDSEDDNEEEDSRLDDSRLDDSRLQQTGRSALGDVTNAGDRGAENSGGEEEVPGSPVLKKKKSVRKLGTTATASRMLCSSAEPSQK